MPSPLIDPALTVNEILLRYPAAVAVTSAYGIDSCCGGGLPLETVARKHQLDLDTLLADLEALVTAESH